MIFSRFQTLLGNRNDIEVIFVNNGSSDDSTTIFKKELRKSENHFAKLVDVPVNKGYGYGIMQGVHTAVGEVIAWTHADMQTDPKDVLVAFDTFSGTPDKEKLFLKGKRMGRTCLDEFFTWGMGVISSRALKENLYDVNAQPKMFHRSFLELLHSPPDDFSLDLYVLYIAKKNDLTIIEKDVNFSERLHGEAKGGGSLKGKVKLILRTWKYIFELKQKLIK